MNQLSNIPTRRTRFMPKSTELPFTDEHIIEMFLNSCQRSSYTVRNYKIAIEKFRGFTGYKPLKNITWMEVESYRKSLIGGEVCNTGKPYAPATVAVHLAALKSLFKWGSEPNIGLFPTNPTSCIRAPKIKINSKNHYLTKQEVIQLIDQLKVNGLRDYLIGLMFVFLGIRVSELVNIRWKDFHTDPAGLSTWLTITNGKGGKEREVKIPDTLEKLLRTYRDIFTRTDEKLFPYTTRYIEKIIQQAREQCGLQKKVTPHWLRHTNATLSLLYGATLQQVQESLGHVQLNTTQRYLHTVQQIHKAAPDYVEDCLKENIYIST